MGLVTLFMCQPVFGQNTFYVSTNGCDTNKGTKASPVKSLHKAKELIKASTGKDTAYVYVEAGTYTMSSPLVFDTEDTRPTVIKGAGMDQTILSGGVEVTGWKPWKNGVWRAKVPQADQYGFTFEQLYVNGKRATRARTPNKNWYYVEGSSEVVRYRGHGRTPEYATQRIDLKPEDIKDLAILSEQEREKVTCLFFHKWDVTRKPIRYCVPDSGYVFTEGEGMKPWNPVAKGDRYILENYLGALDSAGEWFLGLDGWLYYMPLAGENMASASVVAPALTSLVSFKGTEQQPVKGKVFQDVSFLHAAYLMPPTTGNEPMQAAAAVGAAIEGDFAEQLVFRNCRIGHTGGYALWLRQACFDNVIDQCMIDDLGAGGVKLGEAYIRKDGKPVTARNKINNSIIQHAGYVFPCGVGVAIFQSADNEVTHNEISDLQYSGVSIGWKWGYNDRPQWTTYITPTGKLDFEETIAPSPAVGNKVKFNHIHHIGWGELSDMGAVYTLGESPGTEVSNNVIHDVYSYDYGGWGLYTDEGSTGVTMENNLVYACKSGGFHQHYGKENRICNNIFAFGHYYQLQFTRVEPHKSFEFKHNIILQDCGQTASGAWKEANLDMDYNCYWNLKGDTLSFQQTSFKEWKKLKDKHSVEADPQFTDPQNGDFTFKSKRVVKKIGFKPFDYSKAGVYGSAEWKEKAKLDDALVQRFRAIILEREKEHSLYYDN